MPATPHPLSDSPSSPCPNTPASQAPQPMESVARLLDVVAQLRDPVTGCPWDLKQTHQSLKPYMLEEAYEAVEAMDFPPPQPGTSQPDLLQEELGDVLLQVVLHSQLAREAGRFDFDAVCQTLAEKLIRRHPHVFPPDAILNEGESMDSDASTLPADAEEVVSQWERIKRTERAEKAKAAGESAMPHAEEPSVLDGVRRQQPALSRALEISRKAVKAGFVWPDVETLWACVMSEFAEFRAEWEPLGADAETPKDLPAHVVDRLESEMGDILFATTNLARHFKLDPEVALTRATAKFIHRFQTMEALLRERVQGNSTPPTSLAEAMTALDFAAWDDLWAQAKKRCEKKRCEENTSHANVNGGI